MTGEAVELLWVKGSGGDLGHAEGGGAGRAAAGPDAGAGRACIPGWSGRTRWWRRSTTACTARVGRRRHRHGDARAGGRGACRSSASGFRDRDRDRGRRGAADQEDLRRQGGVGAVAPARDSSWAWTSPRSRPANPQAIGCILGGHGITAWGDTSARRPRRNSLWIIDTAAAYLAENSQGGAVRPGPGRLRARCRRRSGGRRPPRWPPTLRSIASADKPMVGHFTDDERGAGVPGLDRASAGWPGWARRCPDHFLRTKVKPLVLDLPAVGVGGGRRSPG